MSSSLLHTYFQRSAFCLVVGVWLHISIFHQLTSLNVAQWLNNGTVQNDQSRLLLVRVVFWRHKQRVTLHVVSPVPFIFHPLPSWFSRPSSSSSLSFSYFIQHRPARSLLSCRSAMCQSFIFTEDVYLIFALLPQLLIMCLIKSTWPLTDALIAKVSALFTCSFWCKKDPREIRNP